MTSETLTSTTVVARKEGFPAANLDGETVLLDVDTGAYYGYDVVGSRIWELIDEPRTIAELCDVLGRQFEVDGVRCESDVISFLTELSSHGLIQVGPHGPDT